MFNRNILFTGAGFTKNFGGLLADEMWSKIFSNSKLCNAPRIKKLLRKDFNFENVYAQVQNPSYVDENHFFFDAVNDSYKDMDETLKSYVYSGNDPYQINIYGIGKLLTMFCGNGGKLGTHFTLNQDLFLDRQKGLTSLGTTKLINGNKTIESCKLPDDNELNKAKENHISSNGNNIFVKLHGSYGWTSSKGDNQMVLGTNKFEDIQREPLLKWYFELFENAIYRQGVKILIVGYGFRDEHINKCLLKAIEEYGLSIYVLSPENPKALEYRLRYGNQPESGIKTEEYTYPIWNGIQGYFPYYLKDIFPSDQSETQIWKNISEIFRN